MNQFYYIKILLVKFQHLEIKEIGIPYDLNVKLIKNFSRMVVQFAYSNAIGSLMYAMNYIDQMLHLQYTSSQDILINQVQIIGK